MPTSDRASSPGRATIFYRCGSMRGKPAREVSATLTQVEFDRVTAEFLVHEIEVFRAATSARQKNATRNLKKYLDADDIVKIEQRGGSLTVDAAIELLL